MLVLLAILLAVMVALPFYIVLESWNQDYVDLVHRGESVNFDQTDIQSYFADATVRHQNLLIILAIAELLLLIPFTLALRAALKS
jgi:hypothetical protein